MDAKIVWAILVFLAIFMGCRQAEKRVIDDESNGEQLLTPSGEPIPQATAIFWVDKRTRKNGEQLHVRTVKARVHITTTGQVTILSYVKEQPNSVKYYLNEKLKYFRVPERMFESEKLAPGEQYVQLRYIPGDMR